MVSLVSAITIAIVLFKKKYNLCLGFAGIFGYIRSLFKTLTCHLVADLRAFHWKRICINHRKKKSPWRQTINLKIYFLSILF